MVVVVAGGYRRKAKVYRLKFEDPDMDGLEIDCKSTSLAALYGHAGELEELAGKDENTITAKDVEALDPMVEAFMGSAIRWNLEDEDGNPVALVKGGPHLCRCGQTQLQSVGQSCMSCSDAYIEGFLDQDLDFQMSVIVAWSEAITGVDVPLGRPSSGGEPSLVASLPMEPLSESHAS
jgi:hypothetical protein